MDITKLINEIQSSNLDSDIISLVCKAVQEYYKTLAAAGAIKKDIEVEVIDETVEDVKGNGEETIKITRRKKKVVKKKKK